jgi:hypothetical protein
MAIIAPDFDNGRWTVIEDVNEGIDETRYIKCIHFASAADSTAGFQVQDDTNGHTILKVKQPINSNSFMEFDPPLKLSQFKMGSDPGGKSQIFIYYA